MTLQAQIVQILAVLGVLGVLGALGSFAPAELLQGRFFPARPTGGTTGWMWR
jgi:hypothetical protein